MDDASRAKGAEDLVGAMVSAECERQGWANSFRVRSATARSGPPDHEAAGIRQLRFSRLRLAWPLSHSCHTGYCRGPLDGERMPCWRGFPDFPILRNRWFDSTPHSHTGRCLQRERGRADQPPPVAVGCVHQGDHGARPPQLVGFPRCLSGPTSNYSPFDDLQDTDRNTSNELFKRPLVSVVSLRVQVPSAPPTHVNPRSPSDGLRAFLRRVFRHLGISLRDSHG